MSAKAPSVARSPVAKKPKKSPKVPKRLKGDQEGVIRSHKGKRFKLVRAKKNLIWKEVPRSPPPRSSTSRMVADVERIVADEQKKSRAARKIQGAWKRRKARVMDFESIVLPSAPGRRKMVSLKPSSRVSRIRTVSYPKEGSARARKYLSAARKALVSASRSLGARDARKSKLSMARKDLSLLDGKLRSLARVPHRVSDIANRIKKAAVKARRGLRKAPSPAASAPSIKMSELLRMISNLKKAVPAAESSRKKKKQVALDAGCIHFVIKPECMSKVCGSKSN